VFFGGKSREFLELEKTRFFEFSRVFAKKKFFFHEKERERHGMRAAGCAPAHSSVVFKRHSSNEHVHASGATVLKRFVCIYIHTKPDREVKSFVGSGKTLQPYRKYGAAEHPYSFPRIQ